jgi:hypothetical protein
MRDHSQYWKLVILPWRLGVDASDVRKFARLRAYDARRMPGRLRSDLEVRGTVLPSTTVFMLRLAARLSEHALRPNALDCFWSPLHLQDKLYVLSYVSYPDKYST